LTEGAPADVDLLRRLFDRECQFYRGRPVPSSADQFAATFDGPGRAVQCALSLIALARQSRIAARAGVHIGEFDVNCSDTPLVGAAMAIASAAKGHEVNASRAVADLLAGSGCACQERGHLPIDGGRPLAVLSVTAQ
jgi:class 3 adenylate cyclase